MEPTRNIQDDAIRELVREHGVINAPSGLTDRIMLMVTPEAGKPVQAYKPLLSRRHVIIIAAVLVLLLAIYGFVIAPESVGASRFTGFFKPVADGLRKFRPGFELPAGSLVIVTIASAAIGFLISLDIVMFGKFRKA